MSRYRHLEDAFQKIRTSTGNSDVQTIVTKFLAREQTYTQLLTAVNGHEKTVDGLKKHNDSREEELHALRIANEDAGEDEPISNTDPVGLEL